MVDPTVAAVVTAHDRRTYLPAAVRSALDSGADEVVVVRNFDGPIAGVEGRYRDVPCSDRETGVKEAVGLATARSDIVGFLDDDDLWEPAKVPRLRELFGSAPDVTYFCHAQLPIDTEGQPVTPRHPEWARRDPARLAAWDHRNYRTLYREIWPGNNSSTVVRRSWAIDWSPALREAGWGADSFWMTAALLGGRPWQLDAARLTRLRLHDVNMSHARGASREEFLSRTAETSARFARSWRVLARLSGERLGPRAELTRFLHAQAVSSEFFASVEGPRPSRKAALRVLGLGPGTLEGSVSVAAWAAAVSPGLARRLLYWSAERRWKLA